MTSNSRRSFRGDAPQIGIPVLERRYWPREPARDAEATLSWQKGSGQVRVKAHLVDLSVGGAAVIIEKPPPRGVVLRLGLARVEQTTVEGRAVAMRLHHKRGWVVLHIKFNAECPKALYDQAMERPDAGE
jgi:PilZ domain